MKKSREKNIQVPRHIIQLISAVLYPGMFIHLWGSVGAVYKLAISGNWQIAAWRSPLGLIIIILLGSVIWGRFFCSFACPFGSIQELMNWLGKRLHIKKIKIEKDIDRKLKKLMYAAIFVSILIWTFQISIDPNYNLTAFDTVASFIGMSSGILIKGTFIIGMIAGGIFVDHLFCRYFCPAGGVFTVLSKVRLFKIRKDNTCINCNICSKVCPMKIDVNLETKNDLKNGECISCLKCLTECPVNAISLTEKQSHNNLIILILAILVSATVLTAFFLFSA